MLQAKAKHQPGNNFMVFILHFCYCSGVPEPAPGQRPEQDDESRSAAGQGSRSDTNRIRSFLLYFYGDKKPYWQQVYRGAYQPENDEPEFFP